MVQSSGPGILNNFYHATVLPASSRFIPYALTLRFHHRPDGNGRRFAVENASHLTGQGGGLTMPEVSETITLYVQPGF